MVLQSRILKFVGVMLVAFHSVHASIDSSVLALSNLERVHVPTSYEVELQKKLKNNRHIKRYAVMAGVATSLIAVVYFSSLFRQKHEEHKFAEFAKKIAVIENSPKQESSSEPVGSHGALWPAYMLFNGVKRMGLSLSELGWDFSRFLADSSSMLVAGIITSAFYERIKAKMVQAYEDETLLWFVDTQTKIDVIFNDLKQRTAEYDLHSALLSSEMISQSTQVHLNAFIAEISDAAANYKHDTLLQDYDYFAYLLTEVKKKYSKKAEIIEQMQEQLVPLLSRRARTVNQYETADLFDRDAACRADIADLCKLLVADINTMLAFIETYKHRQSSRVQDIIASANKFIDHVERLLKASPEELMALSKDNRGLFTLVYEYERLFHQQINYLNTYSTFALA